MVKSAVRELAETKVDDGAPPKLVLQTKGGTTPDGRRVLTESGDVVLGADEILVARADFKRLGLMVLFPTSLTSATRKGLFDLEKDADVVLTSERLVVIVDDLSTKGRWSGSGVGTIVAVGANIAHSVGSKVRHRGEAAVFEIPIAKLNRIQAPRVPTYDWSKKRSVSFGWTEPRNIGTGHFRLVLLDQRGDTDHLAIAAATVNATGGPATAGPIDWSR